MPDYYLCAHDGTNVPWVETDDWNRFIDRFTDVVIKDGVTSVGNNAFVGALASMRVNSVVIPSSVQTIGRSAFCGNLEKIINHAEIPQRVNKNMFQVWWSSEGHIVTNENLMVHVPAGSVEKYKAAPVWRDFNIRAIR
jgi:hypothetical protein